MVINSETLKKLSGIKPDFFYDFRIIHSVIYEFSHSENGPAANSLHQAGNKKYEDFINGISTSLIRQWARNMPSEDVSKDDRYVLRLVTVLHVPYDQLPWLLILQDDHLTAETWTALNAVLSMRKILTIKVFLSLVHLAGGILKNAAG